MHVTYHLQVEEAEAQARAAEVALEQTVEVPRSAITDPIIEAEVMGRVESLEADPLKELSLRLDDVPTLSFVTDWGICHVVSASRSLSE